MQGGDNDSNQNTEIVIEEVHFSMEDSNFNLNETLEIPINEELPVNFLMESVNGHENLEESSSENVRRLCTLLNDSLFFTFSPLQLVHRLHEKFNCLNDYRFVHVLQTSSK